MSSSKVHILKKSMIISLENSLGVVTTACKALSEKDNIEMEWNSLRRRHYQWMESDAEYKKTVNDIENITLDFVETQFHKQIKEGNTACIIFHLKTKGRNRGYSEETTNSNEYETIDFEYTLSK